MQQSDNKKVIKRLLLTVVFMFSFAYMLVPLYGFLCEVTGLNGKTAVAAEEEILARVTPDEERWIDVEFVTSKNENIPWEFSSDVRKMRVNPGKVYAANFHVKNLTSADMVGQAVPSLSPGIAAKYFNKTECFCFTQQPLKGFEEKGMPMRFIIDPSIPEHVRTVTLSYTFFDISDKEENKGDGFIELSKADEVQKTFN